MIAHRAVVVAEMQARDLLRRRVVIGLFVLLPAFFYYSVPAGEDYSLIAGSMGVSWAVAAAGMFGILGWRRADPRLALLGASPLHGLLGRLALLYGLAAVLVMLFAPQILLRSSALIAEPAIMVLALALMAAVSVPLGLAIGAVVPRDMEATLVLIGVVGVGASVPPDAAVSRALPLWGPFDVLQIAAGWADGSPARGTVHTATTAAVLLAIAAVIWHRRVRTARPGAHAGTR